MKNQESNQNKFIIESLRNFFNQIELNSLLFIMLLIDPNW